MKKLISAALALAIAASMTTVAFAADTSITVGGNQTANTVVTYGLEEGYTVVIPDAVNLDETGKGTAELQASNVIIAAGKTLNVRVNGADYQDAWELIDTADATNKLTYVIGKTEGGSDVVNNSVVLSSASGVNSDSTVTQKLYFAIDEDITKSGTYEDTLTFTVSID